ncbi:MAG TPA: potassium channel family protein [Propionibacteriaceae bacterium]|nr:potassium channel family protein [Propionibacteriaceae bacterium]
MRAARANGWWGNVITHPSAVLLVVQLLGVLIYPFMEETAFGRPIFEVFGVLVLALAIFTVRNSPGPTWIMIVLGVAASVLSIVDGLTPSPTLQGASAILHALFYLYAAGSLMVYILNDGQVTADELYAVGATFTLVAWAFAYVYLITQIIWPGSFTAAVNSDAPRTWVELLYLSFATLTSTGLSDIVPISPYARAVSMLEQLAGVGYIALFVSRVVGLTISRQFTADEPSRDA